jgi:hypothetical protein
MYGFKEESALYIILKSHQYSFGRNNGVSYGLVRLVGNHVLIKFDYLLNKEVLLYILSAYSLCHVRCII